MKIAYIYGKENKDYCGEGAYELVFNDEAIGNHYCSNRSFANHDLTVWRLEELNKYEIDKVVSNGEVVWEKDNVKTNNETNDKFKLANDIYEAKIVTKGGNMKYKFERFKNEKIVFEIMSEVKEWITKIIIVNIAK